MYTLHIPVCQASFVPFICSPRLWWMFAISCIDHTIKERNKRCSWSYASRRARQNISYVVGYSNTLAQQQQPVAEAIKEELKAIEREQSVEELCVLRKIAMARIKKQKDLVKVRVGAWYMYTHWDNVQHDCPCPEVYQMF